MGPGQTTSTDPRSIAANHRNWRRKGSCVTDVGRFMAKIKKAQSGCWEWQGARTAGYGSFAIGSGTSDVAHRVMWRWSRGPIPTGFEIDHLCRNRLCVNPDHLEPVTPFENRSRAMRHRYPNGGRRPSGVGHPSRNPLTRERWIAAMRVAKARPDAEQLRAAIGGES